MGSGREGGVGEVLPSHPAWVGWGVSVGEGWGVSEEAW